MNLQETLLILIVFGGNLISSSGAVEAKGTNRKGVVGRKSDPEPKASSGAGGSSKEYYIHVDRRKRSDEDVQPNNSTSRVARGFPYSYQWQYRAPVADVVPFFPPNRRFSSFGPWKPPVFVEHPGPVLIRPPPLTPQGRPIEGAVYPAGTRPLYPAGTRPLYPTGAPPLFPAGAPPLYPAGARPLFPAGARPLYPEGSRPLYPAGTRPLFPTVDPQRQRDEFIVNALYSKTGALPQSPRTVIINPPAGERSDEEIVKSLYKRPGQIPSTFTRPPPPSDFSPDVSSRYPGLPYSHVGITSPEPEPSVHVQRIAPAGRRGKQLATDFSSSTLSPAPDPSTVSSTSAGVPTSRSPNPLNYHAPDARISSFGHQIIHDKNE